MIFKGIINYSSSNLAKSLSPMHFDLLSMRSPPGIQEEGNEEWERNEIRSFCKIILCNTPPRCFD